MFHFFWWLFCIWFFNLIFFWFHEWKIEIVARDVSFGDDDDELNMFQTWNDKQINRKKEYSFIKKLLSLASGLFAHNIRGSDMLCRGESTEFKMRLSHIRKSKFTKKIIDSGKSIFWVLLNFFKLSSQERCYCSFIEMSLFDSHCRRSYCVRFWTISAVERWLFFIFSEQLLADFLKKSS